METFVTKSKTTHKDVQPFNVQLIFKLLYLD